MLKSIGLRSGLGTFNSPKDVETILKIITSQPHSTISSHWILVSIFPMSPTQLPQLRLSLPLLRLEILNVFLPVSGGGRRFLLST